MSINFLPTITLPTRFDIHHQTWTLIDNILIRSPDLSANFSTGIVATKISDHFPCFICIDLPKAKKNADKKHPPKFVTIRDQSDKKIAEFKENLISSNIVNKLDISDTANADTNFTTFANIVDEKNPLLFL